MAARYTVRLSGVDILAVMMLDVLSQLPEIQVCVAYELDDERIDHFPSHVEQLRKVVPIYESLRGWQQDISHVRQLEDLPINARGYLDRLSELTNRPVGVISIGPDRQETIFVDGVGPSVIN